MISLSLGHKSLANVPLAAASQRSDDCTAAYFSHARCIGESSDKTRNLRRLSAWYFLDDLTRASTSPNDLSMNLRSLVTF